MSIDYELGQSKCSAEFTHLIFVEVFKRLDDAAEVAKLTHERCVVVMRLDDISTTRRNGARRLDEICNPILRKML